MLSALLGLVGAAIYGASDFFGGMAARRISAFAVTGIGSTTGLVLILLGSIAIPSIWSGAAIVTGALSGLAGALALVLFYACLAIGPMSILAPITALGSALVPILVGFARGERLSVYGYLGLVVGLIAITLICFVPGEGRVRPSRRGILFAVGASVGVGLYLVTIDLSPASSGLAPLIVSFAVTALVMAAILAVRRFSARGEASGLSRSALAFALLCGATDGVAAVLILVALRLGDLSVVSVLNALAPAGTIVLAAVVLRERIAVVQWAGLAVALVSAGLLALA
ncbi:DMT family transporter [soil metagenome]